METWAINRLTFFLKLFSDITKKSQAKFKYLKNEKSFKDEIEIIFRHF